MLQRVAAQPLLVPQLVSLMASFAAATGCSPLAGQGHSPGAWLALQLSLALAPAPARPGAARCQTPAGTAAPGPEDAPLLVLDLLSGAGCLAQLLDAQRHAHAAQPGPPPLLAPPPGAPGGGGAHIPYHLQLYHLTLGVLQHPACAALLAGASPGGSADFRH